MAFPKPPQRRFTISERDLLVLQGRWGPYLDEARTIVNPDWKYESIYSADKFGTDGKLLNTNRHEKRSYTLKSAWKCANNVLSPIKARPIGYTQAEKDELGIQHCERRDLIPRAYKKGYTQSNRVLREIIMHMLLGHELESDRYNKVDKEIAFSIIAGSEVVSLTYLNKYSMAQP